MPIDIIGGHRSCLAPVADGGWIYFAAIVGHANAYHWHVESCDAQHAARRIYWFFNLVSSRLTHGLDQNGRIDDVSGGLCKSADLASVLETMIAVFTAGFETVKR